MKTRTLIAALLCIVGSSVLAEDAVHSALGTNSPLAHPIKLSLEAGSTGFGGTLAARFCKHFGIAGGADYFAISDTGREISGVKYDAHLRMLNENVALRWYPWTKRSFFVSAGVLINQNRLTGDAVSDGSLEINGVNLPAGERVDLTY